MTCLYLNLLSNSGGASDTGERLSHGRSDDERPVRDGLREKRAAERAVAIASDGSKTKDQRSHEWADDAKAADRAAAVRERAAGPSAVAPKRERGWSIGTGQGNSRG